MTSYCCYLPFTLDSNTNKSDFILCSCYLHLIDDMSSSGRCVSHFIDTQQYYSYYTIKFSELKLIEIVILWVNYTIPYGFSVFRHFLGITYYLFKFFVWLIITDEAQYLKCVYGSYCK